MPDELIGMSSSEVDGVQAPSGREAQYLTVFLDDAPYTIIHELAVEDEFTVEDRTDYELEPMKGLFGRLSPPLSNRWIYRPGNVETIHEYCYDGAHGFNSPVARIYFDAERNVHYVIEQPSVCFPRLPRGLPEKITSVALLPVEPDMEIEGYDASEMSAYGMYYQLPTMPGKPNCLVRFGLVFIGNRDCIERFVSHSAEHVRARYLASCANMKRDLLVVFLESMLVLVGCVIAALIVRGLVRYFSGFFSHWP